MNDHLSSKQSSKRRGQRSYRGSFDKQTAGASAAGQRQGHQRGVLPTPLHVLTFASGSYLRWLALLHANLRLLALPATDLSVCTADETSQWSEHPVADTRSS